nr:uracil-DNA glycosylase [Caballeronia sp. BCC1704]
MALDETLVEELGIGFVWVRRKTGGSGADAVEATARAASAPPAATPLGASRAVSPHAANATPHVEPAAGASSLQTPMPPLDGSHGAAPDAADTRLNSAPADGTRRPQTSTPPLDGSHTVAPDGAPASAVRRPHTLTPPLDASRAVAADTLHTAPHAEPAEAVRRPQTSTPPLDAPAPARADREPAPASAKPRTEPQSEFDAPPSDYPPFDAYDDLPWTDDAPSPATPVAPAVPDDVRTLDWTALEDRVTGCELCRLCERRTNAVFGVGDREADWMLIGEAPGENEDKQGEPFVGQAGKLLDNMLHALGLSRESNVYIANVIKCRPPGNRNPELDEVAQCEPYLQRQVELVKPKIIVALGRFAAQSLLKSEASIAALRGRVHEYRGVPVVVTYHPAYLLRSLPDKAKAWADLCLARKTHADALTALGVEPGAGKGARG